MSLSLSVHRQVARVLLYRFKCAENKVWPANGSSHTTRQVSSAVDPEARRRLTRPRQRRTETNRALDMAGGCAAWVDPPASRILVSRSLSEE